jgi:DNA-binding MarR family transcriptional regulator
VSSEGRDRAELIKAVGRAVRNISGQGVLLSQTVAERVGLNATDLQCLGFLAEEGGMPAGKLAEITGLTTGAVTRLIDRLEQSGYVTRLTDADDRRRVIVKPVDAQVARIAPFFQKLEESVTESLAKYSKSELAFLLEFLEQSKARAAEQTARLRAEGGSGEEAREGGASAPLGAVSEGLLSFTSGASEIVLRTDQLADDLYRARFKGPLPQVRVREGAVTFEYKRLGLADWARLALGSGGKLGAEVTLNSLIPWAIELRRGVSHVNARLLGMKLKALEFRGGASEVDVSLPQPTGEVPVRVSGGVSRMTLRCPPGAPFQLEVSGGAANLKVGPQSFGAIGGRMHWETPSYAAAKDRFQIAVSGGASHLTVEGA